MKGVVESFRLIVRNGYNGFVEMTALFMNGVSRGMSVLGRLWSMYEKCIIQAVLPDISANIYRKGCFIGRTLSPWDLYDDGVVVTIGQGKNDYDYVEVSMDSGKALRLSRGGLEGRKWKSAYSLIRVLVLLSALGTILVKFLELVVVGGKE